MDLTQHHKSAIRQRSTAVSQFLFQFLIQDFHFFFINVNPSSSCRKVIIVHVGIAHNIVKRVLQMLLFSLATKR